MKILTIDTSDRSIVGVVDTDLGDVTELACEVSADTRHHAETLTPMVAKVLTDAGITKPDLIVAGTGPAAFTGLRAGLMTARALARGWDVPVVGVSSLETIALGAARTGADEVLAVIDARRKELFALRARPMGPDDVAVMSGPEIVKPAALPAMLEEAPAVVATSHPDLYPELADATAISCRPAMMATLALSHQGRQDAGEAIDLSTQPQYLRRPDIHNGGVPQPQA